MLSKGDRRLEVLLAIVTALTLTGCGDGDREARRRRAGAHPGFEQLLAVADVQAGASSFGQCAACHSIAEGSPTKAGPNLFGVVGKPIAADPRFGYSYALQQVGGRWTPAKLDNWLRDPARYVPGTAMSFPGVKDPLERADVIAYLRSQAPR